MPASTTKNDLHTPERIRFLDFARGSASLSIVLFHIFNLFATGLFAKLVLFGAAGVHAFLFLSGFGLTLATLRGSIVGFYRRRLRRIVVPYYIFVTLVFVLNSWWSIYPGQGLREYLGHVLLFRMFDETTIGSFGYHLWFLSTIIQLYLVYPLLYHALQRFGSPRFFAFTCLISASFMLLIIVTGQSGKLIYKSSGLLHLWEFALGMTMAMAYQSRGVQFWNWPLQRVAVVTALCLMLLTGLCLLPDPIEELMNNPLALLGYMGATVIWYRTAMYSLWKWVDAGIRRIGDVSFELYLVHGVVVTRLYWQLKPITLVQHMVFVAISLLTSIGLAFAFHLCLKFFGGLQRVVMGWCPHTRSGVSRGL